MHIICFGQQNWDYCWTGKQQLTTRLAARGHRILYLNPTWVPHPVRPSDVLGSLAPLQTGYGLSTPVPNLTVFTYPFARALGWRLNMRRRPGLIARLIRTHGFEGCPTLVHTPDVRRDVEAARCGGKIYFPYDRMDAFDGLSPEVAAQIARDEEALVRGAEIVLGNSPRLLRRFEQMHPRCELFESAADMDHFAPERLDRVSGLPTIRDLPRPRIGFVGQVDDRIDQDLLLHISEARPDWQIVLTGRVRPAPPVDLSRLRARPNIHIIGYQPYEMLPHVFREYDVCVVPYRLNELTHSCSPLKTYEYLATGRPVVATPLESLWRYKDVIPQTSDPEEFVGAIEAALQNPDRGRKERLALAAANNWEQRVDRMEGLLAEAADRAKSRDRATAAVKFVPRFIPDRVGYAQRCVRPKGLTPRERAVFEATRVAGRAYHWLRVAGRALTGKRPLAVRRILVVRDEALGGVIAFLPTLEALRKRYPDAHITVGVQKTAGVEDIIRGSGAVDDVITIDYLSTSLGPLGSLAGVWRLFRQGFDLVVDASPFPEGLLAGAPCRVSLADGTALRRRYNRLVSFDPLRHEVDTNLELAAALGAPIDDAQRVPDVRLDAARVKKECDKALNELGVPADAKLVAMHPGANRASRRWPAERFAELAAGVLRDRPDVWVVFTGVPAEAELVESVHAALPADAAGRAVNAVGRTGLHGLAGMLDRAAAFVCNDTGVMHLARARGTPLVAIMGPDNDQRWSPYPGGRGSAVALRHVVPCAPCLLDKCESLFCLRALTVAQVAAELDRMLEESPGRNGKTNGHAPPSLTVKSTRHNWRGLRDAGVALPRVSVAVLPSANGNGKSAAAHERAMWNVERQYYPEIEVVLPDDRASAAKSTLPIRRVPGPAEPGFRAAVSGTNGSQSSNGSNGKSDGMVALMVAGQVWSSERLGTDVALLTRNPEAVAVRRPVECADDSAPPFTLTIRRSAFRALAERAGRTDPAGLLEDLVEELRAMGQVIEAREPLASRGGTQ